MIFASSNAYFKVLTNAPENIESVDTGGFFEMDEYTKQKIQENNEGLKVKKEFPIISIGEQFSTITINSVDIVDVPVFHSKNEYQLLRGAGHDPNSRFPGQKGRVVIYGHVGLENIFQTLENVKVGDTIELNTTYGDYKYRVTETVVFDQKDTTWVLPLVDESEEQLVVYTCYPFATTRVRTQRFAAICEKVSGTDWSQEVDE